ncbi:MAG: phage major capsid protein [Deltaproteobacteria bacterium]|nr:phage major capsid protein [Deltaproteobacteria bacterium]
MMTDKTVDTLERLDKALDQFKSLNTRFEDSGAEKIPEYKSALDKVDADVQKLIGDVKASRDEAAERSDEIEVELNRAAMHSAGNDRSKIAEAAARFHLTATGQRVDPGDIDVDKYIAYRGALGKYLRKGDARVDRGSLEILESYNVQNKAREGADADGGFFVDDEMDGIIARRLFRTSPMRQIARIRTIGTEGYTYLAKASQSTVGGWVSEQGTATESATATYKKGRIPAHKQYAMPFATEEVLADSSINVEAELANDSAEILSQTENTAFVSGDGAGKPKGFLSYTDSLNNEDDATVLVWGTTQAVITGTDGGFGKFSGTLADESGPFMDLIAELNPQYRQNAVLTMNRGTLATCMKLRDADGNYMWHRGLRESGLFDLLGFAVHEFEDMPAIASDSYSIALGDFNAAYTIVQRQGISILRDPYTTKGIVKFYTTVRVGGGLVNGDAIKLLQFAD